MPGGVVPYSVISPYETLFDKLDQAASDSNCGFLKTNGPLLECFKRDATTGEILFDCLLHLQEWKARSQQLHMLLQIQETIQDAGENFLLTHSTVRLNYYNIADGNSHLLQSVHYDHEPAKPGHPIFHAQF